MDDRDAQRVLTILMEADNNCEGCVRTLVSLFIYFFPVYRAEAEERFEQEFGKPFSPDPWALIKQSQESD